MFEKLIKNIQRKTKLSGGNENKAKVFITNEKIASSCFAVYFVD